MKEKNKKQKTTNNDNVLWRQTWEDDTKKDKSNEDTCYIMPHCGEEGLMYDDNMFVKSPKEIELANALENMGIKHYNECAQKLIKENETLQSLISNKWIDVDDLKFIYLYFQKKQKILSNLIY